MNRLRVGILLFPEVEVLDFAGPYEVFSRTRLEPGTASRRSDDSAPFRVFTVAATSEPVRATGGLQVIPDFSFATAPAIELLVVPGGFGTRTLLHDEATLDWIRATAASARHVASVCSGALLYARLGLLANKRATTHWGALEQLAAIDPTILIDANARFVEDGIVTSAGVSAGIDMAFAMVERLHGREVADETAHYIDYPRVRLPLP
jgi:transcriptional regulator GlxA family with amidase domain